MRPGGCARRMGWGRAGRASHPATAARSGGKSNKIRAMRRRRRRMGVIQRYENSCVPVRVIVVGFLYRGIPTPVFFVSVASKGFSQTVSLLFATLAGRFISVAVKGLRATGRPEVES